MVYPVGNAFLKLSPLDSVRQYHDDSSTSANLNAVVAPVNDVNLAVPLTVKELQRRLNDLGYNAGPVDGLIGSRTIGALKRFQADQGLSVSGDQDRATLQALAREALR
ncbi:peptidoglycan-binding domain-containing protein [Marinobacter goseongensis]|uniref:peptidoglycan-binding domain-containing protein n=1 Tax=Marinobacter goseongensis TaxID=453838 RepID=UPI003D0004C1